MDTPAVGDIVLAHFPAVQSDDTTNYYSAWINWGDGREHRGYVDVNASDVVVSGISCYPKPGTYNVHVTLTASPESQPVTEMSADVLVQTTQSLSDATPQLEPGTDIVEIDWHGQRIEAAAGEWIISMSKPLPGFKPVYMGWEKDFPGVNDYWHALNPELKQTIDTIGIPYEFGGYLGSTDAMMIKVEPSLSQAQVYEAVKTLPGFFAIEPNGIFRMDDLPPVLLDPSAPTPGLAPSLKPILPPTPARAATPSTGTPTIAGLLFAADDKRDDAAA
jgi:hypothetical protein